MPRKSPTQTRTMSNARERARTVARRYGHTLSSFPPAQYCGDWQGAHCVECGATVKVNTKGRVTASDELTGPCRTGTVFGAPSLGLANTFSGSPVGHVDDGDTIECYPAPGLKAVATIHRDDDSGPPDEQSDGFWPNNDQPKSAGYIGPVSDSTLRRHMAHAKHVMESWQRDEWFYCGVGVVNDDANNDEPLTDKYAHAVWGIEANYPPRPDRNGRTRAPDNSYLTETANELLSEALAEALARRDAEHIEQQAAFANIIEGAPAEASDPPRNATGREASGVVG